MKEVQSQTQNVMTVVKLTATDTTSGLLTWVVVTLESSRWEDKVGDEHQYLKKRKRAVKNK